MIDSYGFGEIVVDGQRYTSDVIIYPDRVDSSWWRKEGHRLSIEDLEDIVKAKPETLIVGTGDAGAMNVPEETKDYLEARGIKLVAERSGEACQIYNEMFHSGKIIAALHLTC